MIKTAIKGELVNVINKIGVQDAKFNVEKPAEGKYGDYATNLALVLANKLKKPPIEIAKEIAQKFARLDFVDRIEIEHPGFINFHLKSAFLIDNLKEIIQKADKYGSNETGKGKKIVLEHTDVNPNKALHIGHLRSACLGSACENILRFLGYPVEVEYYVDDTGVQVAISALGILELGLDPEPGEKYDHFAGRVYVEAMKKLENSKKLEQKKEKLIEELDKQKGSHVDFMKEFVANVIRANLETAKRFKIEYDVLIWESDIIKNGFWAEAFEILKRNPNFYLAKTGKNKGCWVMKGISDTEKVIVKSNGVVTYTGKDIAYHLWKFNLLKNDFKYKKQTTDGQRKPLYTTSQAGKTFEIFGKADKVINFIDIRQSFPQEVVKKSLELLGYQKEAKNFKHVAYGIVSLSPKTARALGVELEEGKNQYAMSGRAGVVVLADDLTELIKKKLKQKHPDAPDPDKIATSAIKYLMLLHNTYNDIVFSYDRALDIYGNSGPYLQYTYARSKSVLRKSKKNPVYNNKFTELALSRQELDLLKWLIYFSDTVRESGKQFAPNLLCNYLYELSSRFNTFYNKRPILKSKKGPLSAQFRLYLTAATAQILSNGLDLIGLEKLEKM